MSEFIHIHTPLVLASGSAIRAQMLKGVGLRFSVMPSGVDETSLKSDMQGKEFPDQATALAKAKALPVSKQHPDAITIGADQMCVLDDVVLSKPHTHEKAVAQLKGLSGKTHAQHSAVCLYRGESLLWEYCETAYLSMREMTEAEIVSYINYDQPLHSCGSYKYESMGRHLFSRVEGDADVIKGLPLTALLLMLHQQRIISIG